MDFGLYFSRFACCLLHSISLGVSFYSCSLAVSFHLLAKVAHLQHINFKSLFCNFLRQYQINPTRHNLNKMQPLRIILIFVMNKPQTSDSDSDLTRSTGELKIEPGPYGMLSSLSHHYTSMLIRQR